MNISTENEMNSKITSKLENQWVFASLTEGGGSNKNPLHDPSPEVLKGGFLLRLILSTNIFHLKSFWYWKNDFQKNGSLKKVFPVMSSRCQIDFPSHSVAEKTSERVKIFPVGILTKTRKSVITLRNFLSKIFEKKYLMGILTRMSKHLPVV